MKYAKITDMFAKILFSEELLVNKLCRRALCAITALLFVLCSLPAGARTETEAGGITSYAEDSNGVVEYEIKPRHSDGVTLEYSKTVLQRQPAFRCFHVCGNENCDPRCKVCGGLEL